MNDEPKATEQTEDPMEAMRALLRSTSNRASRRASEKRLRQGEHHAASHTRRRK